ncbi:MAG: FeoA domain-containing protein, partial [Muribaculaceae bacterium]|nr:FeoA domain-containing protein [Muribaculaceae bacterium]
MRLSDLTPGKSGIITKILGHGAFRKRVIEMGFVRGREVTMVLNAPLQDPIKYKLMDYEVSLRRAEANLIEIMPVEGSDDTKHEHNSERISEITKVEEHSGISRDKIINVALVGNPNCGKTSLFNIVSGAHEHVGNYAGVTVGAKAGSMTYKGYHINIIDLPGTYSLS